MTLYSVYSILSLAQISVSIRLCGYALTICWAGGGAGWGWAAERVGSCKVSAAPDRGDPSDDEYRARSRATGRRKRADLQLVAKGVIIVVAIALDNFLYRWSESG